MKREKNTEEIIEEQVVQKYSNWVALTDKAFFSRNA